MSDDNEEEFVAFENSQWRVTMFGLESPEHSYDIVASRLTEMGVEPYCYDWPTHMAAKNWVSLDLFIDAYAFALDFHHDKYQPPLSARTLLRSIKAARAVRKTYYPDES